MAEGKTNLFGKTYNTIGSTDSNFIIKTKGDLKIQWGNKFIDLIKNGKIVSENSEILFLVESPDEIQKNGVYIVTAEENNELWVCIDGIKVQINNTTGENVYVSFMMEQKTTSDQQHQALTNIGFYYETLQKAKSARINSGIIYVEEDNKLYIAKNGNLIQYILSTSQEEDIIQNNIREPLYIEGYSLYADGTEYIQCSGEIIKLLQPVIVYNGIQSNDANPEFGFRLFIDQDKAVLDVDIINWRDYPNPIKYSELSALINSKTLNPKMYYLITDFQNPWEVTWNGEPLYYEDQYTKVKEEEYLSKHRNALQLIVQAKNNEQLEEQAWSPLHPEWVIHYDPSYVGPEHVIMVGEEETKQYGFRSKIVKRQIQIDLENEIYETVEETIYLPCKGRITYLRDEFGNEGDFNFRHHKFKKVCRDKETGDSYTVWRYCMDETSIMQEPSVTFGTFKKETKNNKFFLKDLDSYVQVTNIILTIDPETENVTEYTINQVEPDLQISEGVNLALHCNTIIENNLFEDIGKSDSFIDRAPDLKNNSFESITKIASDMAGIQDNTFTNLAEVTFSGGVYTKNTIIGNPEKTIFFSFLFGTEFTNNYIEECDSFQLFPHTGTFIKNTIIKSTVNIRNTEVEPMAAGDAGTYESNTIKDSTIEIEVSSNHPKNFLKNIIENSTGITIVNHGDIVNNNISEIYQSQITNNGSIQGNNIQKSKVTINNSKTIKDNTIVNSEIIINNNAEISNLGNNTIEEVKKIDNNGVITNNKLFNITSINNQNSILDNILEVEEIVNQGNITNNNIKGKTIDNADVLEKNIIEEIQELINKSTIYDNALGTILKINNSGVLQNNIILKGDNITNTSNLVGNNIEQVTNIDNTGTINNNTIKLITNVNNQGIIKNNSLGIFNGSILNTVTFNDNTINMVTQDLEITTDVSNNTINDMIDITILGDFTNNKMQNIDHVTFNETVDNNEFIDIINSEFFKDISDNSIKANIQNCDFGEFTSNIVHKTLTNFNFNEGTIDSCVFNKTINNFTVSNIIQDCIFNYVNNFSLDKPVYQATFHGTIGNTDRELTNYEWELLEDSSKKKDVYPNIRVVCVPEIIRKGMILMWYGREPIPDGWALCDGKNGTPNLVGSFIKGDSSTDNEPTIPEGVDEETNEFKLETKHLPKHEHPHKEHMHTISGSGSGYVDASGYALTSASPEHVSEGEGSTTYSGDNCSGGTIEISGTISVSVSGNTSEIASQEDEWQYGDTQPIKLEPKHFKIIFIMKIDENLEES